MTGLSSEEMGCGGGGGGAAAGNWTISVKSLVTFSVTVLADKGTLMLSVPERRGKKYIYKDIYTPLVYRDICISKFGTLVSFTEYTHTTSVCIESRREGERERERALGRGSLFGGNIYTYLSNPILFNHSRKNGGSFPTS